MITNYIIKPVVTEKTVTSGENNKFTFIVRKDTTKISLAQQIQAKYGVKPSSINMSNLHPKTRNHGRKTVQKRKAQKRAIITFPKGVNVDIFKPKTPKKK